MGRADTVDAGARAARPITQAEVPGAIDVYRSHVLSLLRPIWWAALSTPSTLWLRGLAVPPFIFFSIYMHIPDNRVLPWVCGSIAALLVPLLVGGFVLLQLHLIARKGTDKDLSEEKLLGYFSDQGWGKGSRFFVVTEGDLARRAAKQAAQAEAKDGMEGDKVEPEAEGEAEAEEKPLLGGSGDGGAGRVLGCLGLANRAGGQGELLYFAVRPGLANAEVVEDALLTAAVAAARKAGCFDSVYIKLNCAEVALLDAAERAGLGLPQPIRINAWFHATRLMLNVRGGRR